MKPERVITGDGSVTYIHPENGASYRSLKGAATESRQVFLEGSQLLNKPGPWRVLELGFGSGLNFETTWRAAVDSERELHYESLEPALLEEELWLVDSGWRQAQRIALTIHRLPWQDFRPPPASYDALYHDPFGPGVSPDCWGEDCFRWGLAALKPDGVLATFGAASATRHAMRGAGLLVGILPGAAGKREMTIASRSVEAIAHARPWKQSW